MSDTPEEKVNSSKSDGENNALENKNSGLADESNPISETGDSKKEASIFAKPPTATYIDEESTIFTTARNYDSKTVVTDSGKKRIIRVVISVVVVLALLGSIFAITKFIPKDESASSSSGASSTVSNLFSIPVIAENAENVESVSVKNSVDSFSLYSKDVETTSSSSTSSDTTSSEATSSKSWFITGLDEDLTSSSLISSYVGKCTSLTAFKLMEDKSLDYGLDTPSTVITVKCKTDYEYSYTITVGDKTPDQSGNYVRIDVTSDSNNDVSTTIPGNGNIYIVTITNLSSYEVAALSFADTKMVTAITQTDANASYFTSSKLSKFDYITLSGTNYASEIRIEPNSDTTATLAFLVTKPDVRYANSDKLDDYLTLFSSGLSASSVVSYSQSAEDLSSYGFNNPKAIITMKVGDKLEKLTVGSEKDSYYYVIVAGKSAIYKVATSSMAYVAMTLTQYYSQFITLDNISTISSMQFTSDGQDITFGLAFTKDENSKDVLTATYDGTTVNSDSLKNLYQYVLLLEPQEYLTDGVEGTNVLTITIKFNNSNSDKIIKLTTYKDSSRLCLASVNGAIQGTISKSAITSIISNAKEVALGNEIASPN